MRTFTFSVRALTDCRILRFPETKFHELVQKMPELAERLVGMMTDRVREMTRREQQRDRLVSLGKLSAGLAHELNNPASAAKRAASQLRAILQKIRDAAHELGRRDLTATQKAEIESWRPPSSSTTIRRLTPWPCPISRSNWIRCCEAMGKTICGSSRPAWPIAISTGRARVPLFGTGARHGPRRAGQNRGRGRGIQPAGRNRKQRVAHFRSGAGHQGIHLHGPGARAKCGTS